MKHPKPNETCAPKLTYPTERDSELGGWPAAAAVNACTAEGDNCQLALTPYLKGFFGEVLTARLNFADRCVG